TRSPEVRLERAHESHIAIGRIRHRAEPYPTAPTRGTKIVEVASAVPEWHDRLHDSGGTVRSLVGAPWALATRGSREALLRCFVRHPPSRRTLPAGAAVGSGDRARERVVAPGPDLLQRVGAACRARRARGRMIAAPRKTEPPDATREAQDHRDER